jgi:hypothetical protein
LVFRPFRETPARTKKSNRGQFRKGEPGPALKHGLYSRKAQLGLLPGQEELRAVLASRRQRLHADQGGTAELSQVLEDTLDRYQRLWVLASTAESRIEREGMFTGKGRTRASVTLYLSIIDRLTKLAQQIGVQRRAKSVPTLEDFLKQREQGEPS